MTECNPECGFILFSVLTVGQFPILDLAPSDLYCPEILPAPGSPGELTSCGGSFRLKVT